jgi:hypothetical protein
MAELEADERRQAGAHKSASDATDGSPEALTGINK